MPTFIAGKDRNSDARVTNPVPVELSDGSNVISSTTNTDKDVNLDGEIGINTNSALFGRVDDSTVKNLRIDSSTEGLLIVDYAHHEIHDGTRFTTCVSTSSLSGGDIGFRFTTPNSSKWMHLIIAVASQDDGVYTFREGGTPTGGGTATVYNRNRNSATTSSSTNFFSGEVATGGSPVIICQKQWGKKEKGGGEDRGLHEWVLKSNTNYSLILSGSGNTPAWMEIDWYEHTNRN